MSEELANYETNSSTKPINEILENLKSQLWKQMLIILEEKKDCHFTVAYADGKLDGLKISQDLINKAIQDLSTAS